MNKLFLKNIVKNGSISLFVALPFLAATETLALDLVTCPLGTSQITYSPGVTNTPQLVSIEGDELSGACISLLHPELTSFSSHYTGEGIYSCNTLVSEEPVTGDQVFVWSTGQTSTWHFTATAVSVGGSTVYTVTGPITSGVLAGTEVTQIVTHTNPSPALCNSQTGVTSLSGPSSYTFSDLN